MGLRVEACSTTGEDKVSESIGRDSRESSRLSTSEVCPAEAGTDVETSCFTSSAIPGVWTSLLYVKYVLPGVYVEGVAEASNGAGKIGPVATGEAVETGGKEAIDGPELLDGNPIAAVGPDMVRGVMKISSLLLALHSRPRILVVRPWIWLVAAGAEVSRS